MAGKKKELSEEEVEEEMKRLDEKMEKLLKDPETLKKVEEYQKKYGTMTWEELHRQFTI